MPELPEVETTRRGLRPWLEGRWFRSIRVHDSRLRWPVPADLPRRLRGQRIERIERRAKYLLVRCQRSSLIVHLGMSGSLRLVREPAARRRHDHLEFELDDTSVLRFHDPRRFGCCLHTTDDPADHPLLRDLGVEPFHRSFHGEHLHRLSRGRTTSVKAFSMDARTVVGVGNIYASEALFEAGIHPARAAGRVSRARYDRLAVAIKEVLRRAVRAGGTTLRDFVHGTGEPGRFAIQLAVYDREGEPCPRCRSPIRQRRIAQRSSYFCPRCQR